MTRRDNCRIEICATRWFPLLMTTRSPAVAVGSAARSARSDPTSALLSTTAVFDPDLAAGAQAVCSPPIARTAPPLAITEPSLTTVTEPERAAFEPAKVRAAMPKLFSPTTVAPAVLVILMSPEPPVPTSQETKQKSPQEVCWSLPPCSRRSVRPRRCPTALSI